MGLPGGRVQGAVGKTPPVGRVLRLRSGLPALQPGGVGVVGLGHLPDPHLHRHAELGAAGVGRTGPVRFVTGPKLVYTWTPVKALRASRCSDRTGPAKNAAAGVPCGSCSEVPPPPPVRTLWWSVAPFAAQDPEVEEKSFPTSCF